MSSPARQSWGLHAVRRPGGPSAPMPLRRTVLHSLEPDDNRFRFFVIEQREAPEGRVVLVRRWGRVGTQGQLAVDATGAPDAIAQAHEALLARRLKRGYRVVEDGAGISSPTDPALALGALVTREAQLVDELERLRERMRAVREALRTPVPAAPATRSPAGAQLELFAWEASSSLMELGA
ncbi:MAG: WGR domain-containing protein [Sandaracinaceae bacterium]|nr:WGR domain-containing protein [Sandaracinaceae bacterium]